MDVAGIRLDEQGVRLAVALGIGLLLGAERERRKGEGPARGAAGIRTFALVALAGGIAMAVGGGLVLAVALGFVALAVLAAYVLGDRTDPGLTTEVAVVVAFLLGALAQQEPQLAAGIAVVVTILLAAREQLHRLVSRALTEQEVHDALLFAGAALVILPLAPNERIGPYGVFNPFAIWRLVVIVMAIGGAGYAAVRLLGARVGLPLSGLAAGFVSSSATIAAMGARARETPALRTPAVAAAVLSTVATVVQMVIIVGATDSRTLARLWPAMAFAGVAAVGYGAVFALRALRDAAADAHHPGGRAFDLKTAVLFAATVTAVLSRLRRPRRLARQPRRPPLGRGGGFRRYPRRGDRRRGARRRRPHRARRRRGADPRRLHHQLGHEDGPRGRFGGGRRFALEVWPGVIATAALAWAGWALT
ncbi:MAG: hypothetical protein KatS3mg063_0306 [Tepidiforma sp.]|nr:DUF4010 domain-containing protein [Tepidiforma sp.]GIW14453.1 MAG: hypothetical protein KatS3mg063_0306 [Tepidiforma sp.]